METPDVKTTEVVEIFKYILMNKGLWNNSDNSYNFTFNEELITFYDADGEVEFQIRDFCNHMFRSILVRFTYDTTHTYREFFYYEFDTIEDLIYEALSDNTIDILDAQVNRKLQAKGE